MIKNRYIFNGFMVLSYSKKVIYRQSYPLHSVNTMFSQRKRIV